MTRPEAAERMVDALVEFVERAAKAGATPEEVKALPEAAHVLSNFLMEYIPS